MNRGMKLLASLLMLIVATAAGVGVSAQTPGAETPACWAEQPNTYAGYQNWTTPPQMTVDPARTYTATITTNKGDIVLQLFPDKAPTTVNNFVCLARAGYYNMSVFHRVISGFMIQGGDPTGTGRGGPGYQIPDELPTDLNYEIGTIAMANAGPNTGGSQFFIVQGDQGTQLPKNYAIFGKVTAGQEIVDAIAAVPVGPNTQEEMSVPIERVGIISVTITEQ